MTIRPFLLSVLCLGLVVGCSKPVTPDPMPTDKTTPQPETPTTGAGQQQGTPVAYVVKNSGIRCIAPPCPTHIATPVNDANAEGIKIHEIDFQDIAPSEEKREALMNQADTSPDGLKVEAVLEKKLKAGPAGDATVLRVKKVL
ncbi:DUF6748 domain-containing protein [Hyalangium versicolor]|uniref:DUF6748 domain-containing protein n=1 Tax=Hyalangium versicolor TaxID=2861190 RepID=UPI001CCB1228|nr:DUF6748 domain-containing protein [Hyalangium versicolor]